MQCTDWKRIDGRKYVRGGKTTGWNISGVSKMTGGNMSGREFARIPVRSGSMKRLAVNFLDE